MNQRNLTPDNTSQGRHAQEESKRQDAQKPPLFNTWNGMYTFVLALHAVVIALLYFFTLNYQ